MKITLESTSKVVTFQAGNKAGTFEFPARIWEGFTDDGIPVHCYITRIAASIHDLTPEAEARFATELTEQKAPSAAIQAIPLRMIL